MLALTSRIRSAYVLFFFIVFPATGLVASTSTYAQSSQMTTGISIGLVGQGDRLIPSVNVGYNRPLVGPLRIHGQFRFSRLETLDSSDLLNRDRLTYLDANLGVRVFPLDIGRHRLTVGAGPTLRGRWEYDTYGVRQRFRNGQLVERIFLTERRKSLDTGVHLKALYSVRITQSLRAELFMEGYNYNEGTGIFFFGVQTAFSL